jgi:hypothetical protein
MRVGSQAVFKKYEEKIKKENRSLSYTIREQKS